MNIQIVSDLHLEFHADDGRAFINSLDPTGVDVLVVAGDLATLPLLRFGLEALCHRFPDVVYVVGNHEYYHSSPQEVHGVLGGLREWLPSLHWLRDEVAEVGGVRFAGTAMWFRDRPDNALYAAELNDFGLIRGFAPWVYEENERALAFLAAEAPRADVVVTHHMPTARCVAPMFARSPLNRFFVCGVDELIETIGPPLWICGHTHASVDCRVGSTRIVCNPLGYVPGSNPEFDDQLVLRVGR